MNPTTSNVINELESDLSNLVGNSSYFGIPHMKFSQNIASWKEIYECILSPLPNKFQTFIDHGKRQKVKEAVENERKKRIISQIKLVQQEFAKNSNSDLYTSKEIIENVMIAYKMKHDMKYKEKILCTGSPIKSAQIRKFLKDAKNVINNVLNRIYEIFHEEEKKENEIIPHKHDTIALDFSPSYRLMTKKMPKKGNSKSLIVESGNPKITEDEKEISLNKYRGKSCCCSDCGGLKYYKLFQKRINLFTIGPDSTMPIKCMKKLPLIKFALSPEKSFANRKKSLNSPTHLQSCKLISSPSSPKFSNKIPNPHKEIAELVRKSFHKNFNSANPRLESLLSRKSLSSANKKTKISPFPYTVTRKAGSLFHNKSNSIFISNSGTPNSDFHISLESPKILRDSQNPKIKNKSSFNSFSLANSPKRCEKKSEPLIKKHRISLYFPQLANKPLLISAPRKLQIKTICKNTDKSKVNEKGNKIMILHHVKSTTGLY